MLFRERSRRIDELNARREVMQERVVGQFEIR
jgi:hypothetical protein